MNLVARICGALLLGVLMAGAAAQERTRPAEHDTRWVAAWVAAPQDYQLSVPSLTAAADLMTPPTPPLVGITLRQSLQPTLDGQRVRIRFSNRFGKVRLHIASASLARSNGGAAVAQATLRPLRFGGRGDITIAPGAEVWSDAAPFAVEAGQPVAVSFYLDASTPLSTVYQFMSGSAWAVAGDAALRPDWQAAVRSPWSHFVTGLDVASPNAGAVVAFGDSITEGSGFEGEPGKPVRYPERLAARLRASQGNGRPLAVVNAGISGNRLLADVVGPKGVVRFERDVLAQSGVTHVVILIGINDIGLTLPDASGAARDTLTARQLASGLELLIDQARARRVQVLLGTLLPFKGSVYWSPEKEATREALNAWIRGRQDVAAVVDFDAALRDPADPMVMRDAYDSGDHLHPGAAGLAAMAEAIDLHTLRP